MKVIEPTTYCSFRPYLLGPIPPTATACLDQKYFKQKKNYNPVIIIYYVFFFFFFRGGIITYLKALLIFT